MSSNDNPTIVRELPANLNDLTIRDFQRDKSGDSALRIDREDKFYAVLKVSELLSSPEDLETLLARIVDLIFEIMDIDRAVILLIHENTGELEPKIIRSKSETQEGQQIYSRNIVNHVVSRNVSVLSADTQSDPRFGSAASVVMQSIRSSLCVPLRAREKVIGAIYVDNRLARNRFGDEELEFLTGFANQAGLAIENSRLYTRIEQEARFREQELQLLVHKRTLSLLEEKEKAEAASLEAKNQKEIAEEVSVKLKTELLEAADYVRSLLPLPLEGEIRADWQFLPSVFLGGDSFGYQWLDEDRFAMYLLDVCGHGIGGALLSVTLMDVLNTLSLNDTDFFNPASVLSALNRTYPMEKHHGRFFTVWYGVYDRRDSSLTYCSGGHPPAVLIDSKGGRTLLQTRSLSVGLLPSASYTAATVSVEKPSKLMLFSDGVFENMKPDSSLMNLDEFLQQIEATNWDSTSETLMDLIRSICIFPFEDDFSLVQITFGNNSIE